MACVNLYVNFTFFSLDDWSFEVCKIHFSSKLHFQYFSVLSGWEGKKGMAEIQPREKKMSFQWFR